ncbi:3-deoxy-manno-octulosonate cytidylyltransferase [Croceitalea dokdonensis DOKDO 023]|uniref:3-deoxy-manno-octulosonate cytidylyltransferase n=1 Tax=Croceitalea dokdonensis DOKDO 023 TaxID=1300341 RepID=A0A0P7A1V1_9FLAO|nr:3-deoxy-manno-octulosonate cytidylyltransferase [Croceitalea dokdonensis]KPM30409.1 3-deoxy-manno-octulosonate cytidylyltransferase [Croceitalea dokdonensis DOKDO 023]
MIPARYQASRFPAKLMQDLNGKPVILRTYEAVMKTGLFDDVVVVTDSPVIYDLIRENNGNAMMSKNQHESGSDRIAEAVEDLDVDIAINVQGDEPFIDHVSLERIIKVFYEDEAGEIDLASLMTPITDWEEINNPNTVKVIVDHRNFALYFSRSPIPFPRDKNAGATYYKHKGIYAFRKRALADFKQLLMRPLEATEKIEAIRFLEYGKKIKMVETHVTGIEIDTPEDLERAKKAWK